MRVLISGYYGFGNVGDEAVLEAILKGLRRQVKKIEITVLSSQPKLTAEFNSVRSIHRYNPFKILFALARTDVFVSGGGTLFQDTTSRHSFWYYIGLVWLAKLFGKKVMVMAQGFGPLNSRFDQGLAKRVLDRVDQITLRDEDSLAQLKKIGLSRPPISVTADPTFILQGIDKAIGRKILALEGVPLHKKLLGVAVRSVPGNIEAEEKFISLLAPKLDHIVRTHGWQPVFVLFQCPEDMRETAKVVKKMREQAQVIFRVCRPDEMISVFSHFEAVVGMRLHSLIFSALEKTPMLGVSYDPKVKAFMRSIDQPCLDLNALNDLEPMLDKVVAEKGPIKQELDKRLSEMVKRAQKNFEVFAERFGSQR